MRRQQQLGLPGLPACLQCIPDLLAKNLLDILIKQSQHVLPKLLGSLTNPLINFFLLSHRVALHGLEMSFTIQHDEQLAVCFIHIYIGRTKV